MFYEIISHTGLSQQSRIRNSLKSKNFYKMLPVMVLTQAKNIKPRQNIYHEKNRESVP